MKNYIGIDPGKNGGIVVLWKDNTLSTSTIPIINDDIDVQQLVRYFQIFNGIEDECTVVLENVHSIYGTSAKSNFTFGKVNGVLQTLIEVHNLPYIKVSPKKWQKIAFEGIAENEDKKIMALQASRRLFPNFSFISSERARKPHDGLIDAALMAYYGKVSNL